MVVRNLKKQQGPIKVITPLKAFLTSLNRTDFKAHFLSSAMSFNNLITISLQIMPALASHISITLFSVHSVNSPKKRTEISTIITDCNVQLMLLTETWFKVRGDNTKCSDLTPAGYITSGLFLDPP